MPSPPIYLLPAALRRYQIESVYEPRENQCQLCWRDYGTKDDSSDETERACRAVQVLPCRHEFGDQCIMQTTTQGSSTCPLCRTDFAVVPNESLYILEQAANLAPFKFLNDRVVARVRLGTHGDTFDELNQRLFDDAIDALKLLVLLYLYARTCSQVIVSLLLQIALAWTSPCIAMALIWIFEEILSPSWLSFLADWRTLYHNGKAMSLPDAAMSWAYDVVLQVRGPLLVSLLIWVAYVAVVASLIIAGARHRGRKEKGPRAPRNLTALR